MEPIDQLARDDPRDTLQDRRDYTFDDPEAELTLLSRGLSLADPDPTLLASVAPSDFADPATGTLWAAARAILDAGQLCTRSRILEQVAHTGTELRQHVLTGRLELADMRTATDRQAGEAARTVRQLAERRRLRGALQSAMFALEAGQDAGSTSELLSEHLRRLDEADTRTGDDVLTFGEAVAAWRDRQARPLSQPIPTPFPDLNAVIADGLQGGRTYVIGARPGAGTCVVGANHAPYDAEWGVGALVFSAEMPVHEVAARMIAAGAQADYTQLQRRRLSQWHKDSVDTYLAEHEATLPLFVVDKHNISTEYIATVCRRMKRRHGVRVVFVDYLQLLRETDSRAARERQVASMSRALKVLAVELDLAIIIACQLNRGSAGEKRVPSLIDLRESGAIEQDADVVLLLHHDPDDPNSGEVQVIAAKNRTGPAGGHLRLGWAPHQARMGHIGTEGSR